ncbi:2OG-Fe(II) oxygenase family protein [Xenorhabdus griffiniae]|uniref:2OG-Fe(II) oxygenase family protein n=1 Tax=Xenorhabdus griffiniae TaxID=351672 RepID=UPI002359F21D|nr:2OG-Fe(II) oxygenase family protein [Xenorhabdus griffiniae]MDC9607177.1 2OG-Fe(II) oxygenase family protein [Xenorhabdus griffiniae]
MTNVLPDAKIINNNLVFSTQDGFIKACQYGAFHLKYPENIDFSPGIKLAQNYYLEKDGGVLDEYKGFHKKVFDKSLLGYSSTGNDQDELLQIENFLWKTYFPKGVSSLLFKINAVSKIVLNEIFRFYNINHHDIEIITGGLNKDESLQYCIFNHYRSNIKHPVGLTAHKDSGFITTLYTIEPGLESFYEENWIPFDPKCGYFTIVMGHSLEILTENKNIPIKASYHRVRPSIERRHHKEERFTFGVYIGPTWQQNLYQYSRDGSLVSIESFLDFQKRKAKEMKYKFHPKVEVLYNK